MVPELPEEVSRPYVSFGGSVSRDEGQPLVEGPDRLFVVDRNEHWVIRELARALHHG